MGCSGFHGNAHPQAQAPLLHLCRASQPVLWESDSPYIQSFSQPEAFADTSLLPPNLAALEAVWAHRGFHKALPAHIPHICVPPECKAGLL